MTPDQIVSAFAHHPVFALCFVILIAAVIIRGGAAVAVGLLIALFVVVSAHHTPSAAASPPVAADRAGIPSSVAPAAAGAPLIRGGAL